ncbi:MAG: PDZ domain-containing protein [Labilithrix sp.]|nr:PDZ domain-containing protein [Labilithrix sp.]
MARPVLLAVPLLLPLLAASAASAAPSVLKAPPALPALPGTSQPASGPAPSPVELSGFSAEQVRRGVVQVEQGGRPLAVGTVIMKDGRIVTALSPLANAGDVDIRYADGSVVKGKVVHRDKAWDLALVVPQTGKWLDGLVPTDADPQGVELRAFLPKAGKLAPAPLAVKGRVDAKSKEGESLRSALDMDAKGATTVLGAPLIDPNGRVVGVLVKACKDGAPNAAAQPAQAAAQPPCSPLVVGAPVYAIRSFLQKTPANAVQPAPWLGLAGGPSESGNVKGVRVVAVAPGSPAEKAGLKGGDSPDTIVAVDGQPVETPEQLADVIAKRAIGQQVKLLVFSGGKFREASTTLRSAP